MMQDVLSALENRVLGIKNYHLLVSDKQLRAVGAEMHKKDFSCLKELSLRKQEDGELKRLCICHPSC